jgi:hypothetical protein
MAITRYEFKGNTPQSREGKGIQGEDGEEMTLGALLIKALDEVDLRKPNPQTGIPTGQETSGAIRKRISLADKIAEAGDDTIQLESTEVELLEQVVTTHLTPRAALLVIKALDACKVQPN